MSSPPAVGVQGALAAVDRLERSHVALVLRVCGGNRERAAGELAASPARLDRWRERLGLEGSEVS